MPAIGGTYRRPLAQDPSSLDPAKIADLYGVAVANQIFDGLVAFDAHLNVVPALAQSWSASRDGLVWTFHLRKGVQFHNGREMNAEDVVYSLSRLLDPAVGSRSSPLLDKVKGAAEFRAGTTKVLEGIKASRSLYRRGFPLRALRPLHQHPGHGPYIYSAPGRSRAVGSGLWNGACGHWSLSLRAMGAGTGDPSRDQQALFWGAASPGSRPLCHLSREYTKRYAESL